MIAPLAVAATPTEVPWDAMTLRKRTKTRTGSPTRHTEARNQATTTLDEYGIDVRRPVRHDLGRTNDLRDENTSCPGRANTGVVFDDQSYSIDHTRSVLFPFGNERVQVISILFALPIPPIKIILFLNCSPPLRFSGADTCDGLLRLPTIPGQATRPGLAILSTLLA